MEYHPNINCFGIIMTFTSPLFWARMITQTAIWYSPWRDSCYFIHAMKNSWFPDCPKFRLACYYTLYHGLYVSCLSEKIHSATIGFSSRPFGLDQRRWKTKWRPPRFTGNRANYGCPWAVIICLIELIHVLLILYANFFLAGKFKRCYLVPFQTNLLVRNSLASYE